MTNHHPHPTLPEAQPLAQATAAAMWERDLAAQALSMRIINVSPGCAVLSMPARAGLQSSRANRTRHSPKPFDYCPQETP